MSSFAMLSNIGLITSLLKFYRFLAKQEEQIQKLKGSIVLLLKELAVKKQISGFSTRLKSVARSYKLEANQLNEGLLLFPYSRGKALV